jgi:SAM-dependent MidA family methyltransferase
MSSSVHVVVVIDIIPFLFVFLRSRIVLQLLNSINDRQHVEISPERGVMMQTLCKHISIHGGSALIGDYGHWGEKEDTFRVHSYRVYPTR